MYRIIYVNCHNVYERRRYAIAAVDDTPNPSAQGAIETGQGHP
jgi:hypothetical protein